MPNAVAVRDTPGTSAGERVPTLPRGLSPSSMATYEQCPIRFKFSKIDRLPDPSGVEAVLGTFVHGVLEELMGLPAEQRSVEAARWIATGRRCTLDADTDWLRLALSEEQAHKWRQRAWRAIVGYFEIENPSTVTVVGTERRYEAALGGVSVTGIIDRLDQGDAGLVVNDYKTGKVPSPRYRSKVRLQVATYGALLAELGQRAVEARLIYSTYGEVVRYRLDESTTAKAIKRVQHVWSSMRVDFEAGHFAAKPGPLCGWCAFKGICPAWDAPDHATSPSGSRGRNR